MGSGLDIGHFLYTYLMSSPYLSLYAEIANQKIYNMLKINNQNDFWQGLNEEELRYRYVGAPENVFRQITTLWDLSEKAKKKNECDTEYLSQSSLYIAAPTWLAPRMLMNREYTYAEFWAAGHQSPFLRVLGLWQKNIHLPPSVIRPTNEGGLVKLDGFHRLALAVISGPPTLPFYCCFNEIPEGIELMNSEAEPNA